MWDDEQRKRMAERHSDVWRIIVSSSLRRRGLAKTPGQVSPVTTALLIGLACGSWIIVLILLLFIR